MKGVIFPLTVWGLVACPLLCAGFRVRARVLVGGASVVTALAVALWIAAAGYGYTLTENLTGSLSGHLYLHRKGARFARGDLVAYRWHGGATYPRGTIFIKQVVGLPGDMVRREGNRFWVAGHYIGEAKPRSKAGVPLAPAQAGIIPSGAYFVATPHPDSLDSRYALSGNIQRAAIIGRAYELF